jgi:hypothetical protein
MIDSFAFLSFWIGFWGEEIRYAGEVAQNAIHYGSYGWTHRLFLLNGYLFSIATA